jgi:TRAP-type mannitol/chloroaromatic compound transport system substrate-binding protein
MFPPCHSRYAPDVSNPAPLPDQPAAANLATEPTFEILFNKSKYDALPLEHQAIIRYAAESSSSDFSWKIQDRYSRDLEEMVKKQGVKAVQTPREILDAQLAAWDRVIARLSADPFIKKVMDSQKDWVKRVGGFHQFYEADNRMAFDHFFKNT